MSDQTLKDSPSAVCVLGMHRCGTSTLSGILNLLGFHIGRQSVLMRPDEFNAKGYWEHQLLTDLNDEILSRLGGNWHTPPPFPPGWEKAPELEDLRQRARTLIQEEFGPVNAWSWKDPRNCLLLPFWQALLPPMRYVICLRNPIGVAKSLMRRNDFSLEKSVELWLTHVKSALVHSENHPRLFVCYEELLADPEAELRRIGRFLGKAELVELESTRQSVHEFIDKELCHNQAQLIDVIHEPRLPYEEKSLYTVLQLIGNLLKSGDGTKESDRHLNQILNRLGECAWDARVGFKGKVAELAVSTGKRAELERQQAKLEGQLRVQHSENRRLNEELRVQLSEHRRLDEELRVEHSENRRLNEVVSSAEQWQTSWFRRVFHRWHPPGGIRERIGFLKKMERSIRKRRRRLMNGVRPAGAFETKKTGFWRRLERSIRKRRKWLLGQSAGQRVERPGIHPVKQPDHPELREWRPAEGKRRVVYISGEPDTPGHSYRVQMYADTLAHHGYSVQILRLDQIRQNLALIETAQVAVVWRAPWSEDLAGAVAALKKNGGKLVFDVDDYMFDPALAKVAIIDGIRSMGLNEADISRFYDQILQTMLAADYCTCPTNPLATAMRRFQKAAFVLPNGYDDETYVRSRRAAAKWRKDKGDDLVRLGYAGGSRTHQKDFSRAAPAVARILREHPECRLVLFRAEFPNGRVPLLDVEEFPDLAGLESQIEWRPLVPLRQLPGEIARFDINLAPLEAGNLFCECKSELKYFEAALAGVPTIASPTRPYVEAIRHDESSYLAANPEEWYACLKRLVTEPMLRRRIANEALCDVLWRNGPERRAELADNVMEQIVLGGRTAAKLFELDLHRAKMPRRSAPQTAEHDVILEFGERAHSDADVVIPLYNYSQHVEEALESVKAQTLKKTGLIIVDDCSTDNSLAVVQRWMERNQASFIHVALLKNRRNSGLAHTRNTGFAFTDARFVMPLDADNVLHPQCLECCLKAITSSQAAVAFPTIKEFGDTHGNRSCNEWCPSRFVSGNYIDAMALIRRTAWVAAGGYERIEVAGWEDYDLWCKFVHLGLWGVWLPEVLAAYRVHDQSMLNTTTDLSQKKRLLISEMHRRHGWLDILPP